MHEPRVSSDSTSAPEGLRLRGPFGISLVLHSTFFWLLFGLFLFVYARGDHVGQILSQGLSTLLVVCSVLIHEFAHAVTAQKLRVPVTDVQVRMFYGVARIGPIPTLREEAIIAMAGPAANLLLAAVLVPVIGGPPSSLKEVAESPLAVFFLVNALMGVVNLTPALPLDGGRVMRAVLVPAVGVERATSIVLALGLLVSVGVCLVPVAFGFAPASLPVGLVGLWLLTLLYAERRRENLLREGRRVQRHVEVERLQRPPTSTIEARPAGSDDPPVE
jgi:Zn-dependent protease